MPVEIQCGSVTSSRRYRARKQHKCKDRIYYNCKDLEIENLNADKSAILSLVKRNLQKMCLTKSSTSHDDPQPPLQNNRLPPFTEPPPPKHNAPLDFSAANSPTNASSTILGGYDYDRSRSTKELLRKAILERRKPHIAVAMVEEIRIDFKQKIWRPW